MNDWIGLFDPVILQKEIVIKTTLKRIDLKFIIIQISNI